MDDCVWNGMLLIKYCTVYSVITKSALFHNNIAF